MYIDFSLFRLKQEYFDHESVLHGINHTYRVMCHCLKIGEAASLNYEIKLAFCAAFIHDMARKNDGYCPLHGTWAAKEKLPFFKELFFQVGVKPEDLGEIELALKNHSLAEEIEKNHPYYNTVALLKDADALDRIRIAEDNLNKDFLRFPQSVEQINFAKNLYYKTCNSGFNKFEEMMNIAQEIE